MNLNNLQNLKDELKELRFDQKLAVEMEQHMGKDEPAFQLKTQIPGNKGQVDMTLNFKQSSQSEHYFLNKFDVVLNKAKPLEAEHKYWVVSPGENNKPMFKKFDSAYEAIDFFKGNKGDTELASGKDLAHKTTLATMVNDKVNYVEKGFERTFHTAPVTQTFFVDKGNGFNAEQAANMVQGRAVYRDDLVNTAGMAYKAWVKLDFDRPKDRHSNFPTNQYHDPSYGFHVADVLAKYNIKELADPAKMEMLIESLKNGNRPLVTTEKDGQEVKLHIEAVPRYSQINMYQENGKPEKREQFLKEQTKDNVLQVDKGKGKEKEEAHELTR